MAGLVVSDTGGGDHCWIVVDDELWKQVVEIQQTFEETDPWMERLKVHVTEHTRIDWVRHEVIGWLTCPDKDVDWPFNTPRNIKRQGKIINRFFTQGNVVEPEALNGIVGVLVTP
jgi:hypothetical protein